MRAGGAAEDDATIKVKPTASRPGAFKPGVFKSGAFNSDAPSYAGVTPGALTRRRVLSAMAIGGAAAACYGICGWLLWPRHPAAPPAAPPAIAPPPPPTAQPFRIETADEPTILAHVAEQLTVIRFALNPDIAVLDFPSLRMQGEMLNRVASLIEKAGLPRNQVLTDAALDYAIRERGDTAETYYYGHDYPAGALVEFFNLADREHVALDPEEERLRALVRQLGWFSPGAVGALISVTRIDETVTETMRATILHHELSHGQFFSDPAYANYVHEFWLRAMTDEEREAIRRFLGSMGYDAGIEELMYNEMQAYMMFTYDPRFFLPSNVNMTPARRLQLQMAFLKGMPEFWLKPALAQHLRQAAD